MRFQRIKTGILAGVMAMSLAAPAFAAADPLNPAPLTVKGTTQLPTINMQMPTSPAIVLNPYKLNVTFDKAKIQDQIASPVFSVVNLSDCPIQVGVKGKASVGGNVVLATGSTTANDFNATADKLDVYIALQGVVADKAGTEIAEDAKKVVLTDTDQDLPTFETADGTAAAEANTLKAATAGKASATASAFNFTFVGDTVTKGTWTAKDTVTPAVTFKFTPQPLVVDEG